MEKKIKTGVLSYGMSGTLFHCPFLSLHDGFELSGIVERTKKKASLAYSQIKSYNSVDEMLNDAELELIVVNTPSPTHFEFAMKALNAGKHVLVEKPFTTTSSEAKELFIEAKKKNCHVFPFQNRRFDSDFLSMKKIVNSGVLGDLIEAHFRFDRYKIDISDNVVKESLAPGSGVLYNLGPHIIDAAIDLFGLPNKYLKIKMRNRPNTKIDDFGSFHLQYENGLQVFLTVSLLVADIQKSFVLHGKKGSFVKDRTDIQEEQLKKGMLPNETGFGVELPNSEGILTTITNRIVTKEKIIAEPSNYMRLFDAVYHTIRNSKPYLVSEEQIVKQIEILED
tara:strand:+ start:4102 stop:5112 length:1011 start_codon:yes stop_codon:yes gene_type:complete